MARPRSYQEVCIEGIDMKGHGVAHRDGFALFVEGALPGDIVDVDVRRRKSTRVECRTTTVRSRAIGRVKAFCSHFDDCGGCTWQDVGYGDQLEMKSLIVRTAFEQFRVTVDSPFEPILGSDATSEYRNRLDYSFSSRRWVTKSEAAAGSAIDRSGALGFHAPKRFDKVLAIDHCYLQSEPTNRIRNSLESFAKGLGCEFYDPVKNSGYLRNLVIRTSIFGEVLVLIVFGYDDPQFRDAIADHLLASFPEITSLCGSVNPSVNDDLHPHPVFVLGGSSSIRERCGENTLLIDAKSFYQTNPVQAEKLYAIVAHWAALCGTETILDLYCGIGSIALYLANHCRRAIGIELQPAAIDRARENAKLNNVDNVEFRVGSAEEELPAIASRDPAPDLVILDPPRSGLHHKVIAALLTLRPRRIIYVSCNPASQAKNIADLEHQYRVTRVRPIDMFPHTRHVENIAELTLRDRTLVSRFDSVSEIS